MNVEPYLVASSVVLTMAQRLLRKLCPHCKVPLKPPSKALIQEGFDPKVIPDVSLFGPKGCPKCFNTGYLGRVGIFEVLAVNDEIREMFLDRAPIAEVKREARRFGMRTLRQMGLEKAKAGVTSIEEVTASTMPDR
jgi:type IV pilus assembly protein PilB